MSEAFAGYVCTSAAIDAAVAERAMLTHPFYQAWEEGKLTREALGLYAAQYFHHVEAFPRAVSAVHANCPDAKGRRLLAENLAEEEGVELVKFDQKCWRRQMPLTAWLNSCDYLVNVAKFKTHDFAILTAAIKNLFGLVSGTYKTELHKKYFNPEDFAKMLVDIYEEARPALTIVDGIIAMEGDGPATRGKLRNLGLLFAGSDCVAIDSILALIMGLDPCDISTTKEAAKRGLGVADINSIQILGQRLEEVINEPFQLPSTSIVRRIPRPILEIGKKFIRFFPQVEYGNCILCRACCDACPNKAISVKSKRIVIDYSKCISCFCCQEACPNSAIKVKKSVLVKIVDWLRQSDYK